MRSFRWLVSAEDTPYMAWQCWLFRYSARTRCDVEPTFIVHRREPRRDALFDRMARAGADLHLVDNYRLRPDGMYYAPRNSAGTLLEAARRFSEDYFILFDPDMLCAGAPDWQGALSADKVDSLGPGHPDVRAALDRAALDPADRGWLEEDARVSVGVPYVIPRPLAAELGAAWMRLIDAEPVFNWAMVMWDFALACVKLGHRYQVTALADMNWRGATPRTKPLIHYCYGDETWTKRNFLVDSRSVFQRIPSGAAAGTVEGEIFEQLAGAARELG
jgi:hypothetical protein